MRKTIHDPKLKPLRINERSETMLSIQEHEKRILYLKKVLAAKNKLLEETLELVASQQLQLDFFIQEIKQLKEGSIPTRDDYDFELQTFGFHLSELMYDD